MTMSVAVWLARARMQRRHAEGLAPWTPCDHPQRAVGAR
jgi:hypothetical protein